MSGANTREPKTAAAIIIARPAHPRGFEVLLTRSFAADPANVDPAEYGFPAGLSRAEDASDGMLARSSGLTPERARAVVGAHFSPRKALALWLTAIREAFEKTGILFAVTDGGRHVPLADGLREEIHAALASGRAPFSELLEKANLFCDAAALAYFSHWRIPGGAGALIDTRFFLAELPEQQAPFAAERQPAQALWLVPDKALYLFDKSQLPLSFSTFASLRALADFDSLEAVLQESGGGKI